MYSLNFTYKQLLQTDGNHMKILKLFYLKNNEIIIAQVKKTFVICVK